MMNTNGLLENSTRDQNICTINIKSECEREFVVEALIDAMEGGGFATSMPEPTS